MFLRSAVDEVVDWFDYQRMLADMEAMEAQIDGLLQRNAALERDLRSEQILSASMAGRRAGEVRHDRNGEPMPVPAPTRCAMMHGSLCACILPTGNGQRRIGRQRPDGKQSRWAAARDELQRHNIVTTQGRQTIMLASSGRKPWRCWWETRKEREMMGQTLWNVLTGKRQMTQTGWFRAYAGDLADLVAELTARAERAEAARTALDSKEVSSLLGKGKAVVSAIPWRSLASIYAHQA